VQRDPLEHRCLDFNQVAFLDGQEAQNEVNVPWEHLKHRFIDFIEVEIWACQEVSK